MSRYRGPKNRIARRLGTNIFGRARNPLLHKVNPPGMHGARRRKKSDFGLALEEKQKLKAAYGMLTERQLVKYFKEALRRKGSTAENLLAQLESRLDVVVYRLKLAPTIFAAHQLVSHGHVQVDGKKVDIRSYLCKPGQTASIREKSRKIPVVVHATESAQRDVPGYLSADPTNFCGQFVTFPKPEEIPLPIEVNVPEVCDFLAHTT